MLKKVALSEQLRSLVDQDRGSALLNGQNALGNLGGTGKTRRVDAWMEGKQF